ncbi:protein-glutamate O-methyltransferase CheR [Pokkaliibacter sp. MBI-7]|nr:MULTISPECIES: protein-glutamate O-methyltransferase CheR [Pokkaliibacter]MDH2431330.1 protein-glutamate O-methyltransferase CheR [Pokkaliibacter sp. MBI-7]
MNQNSYQAPDMSSQDFAAFKDYLEKACGILLGENKQYLVKSRLSKLMAEHRFASLGELLKRLQSSAFSGLRQEVINAMTTNETLWFRDIHPYTIIQERILPELDEKGRGQTLKIWSAACSTGQEPYSLSMLVDETKQKRLGSLRGDVRITATDISTAVLEQAKAGKYESLALGRGLSPERLKRFFNQCTDGSWEVKREIKQRVDFKTLNLKDSYSMLGRFDLVLCRNVLIYFSPELKQDILRRIHKTLQPGGYLMVGASEAVTGLNDIYEMVQCNPGIIYRAK